MRVAFGVLAYGGRINSGHLLQGGQIAWHWSRASMPAPLFMTVDSAGVDKARNVLMEKALQAPVDWLVQCDADTYFPIAPKIYQFLETAQKQDAAVIGAPVKMRKRPGYNVCDAKFNLLPEEVWRNQVVEVERIGTAFTAVNLKWMRATWPAAPWYRFDYQAKADGTGIECTGEDYYFCAGVKARGGKILADGRFEPVHVGATDETAMLMALGAEVSSTDG